MSLSKKAKEKRKEGLKEVVRAGDEEKEQGAAFLKEETLLAEARQQLLAPDAGGQKG